MPWVREGLCNQCGDCCIGNPFPEFPDRLDGMCPLLSAVTPEGKLVCTIHDTDNHYWRIACSLWPAVPEHIAHLPRCSFSFRWSDD